MKWGLLLSVLVLTVLISGCVQRPEIEKPSDIQSIERIAEELGGRYQGQLIVIEGNVTKDGVTRPLLHCLL